MQMLEKSKIRIDRDVQARVSVDDAVVAEYAEAMTAGAEFPPVTCFGTEAEAWLADGFHRVAAARRAGHKTIAAQLYAGSREDARWYAAGANATHGLRRTNADKRRAVEIALGLKPDLSDRAIAEHVAVSPTTVGTIRGEVSKLDTCAKRTGRDGKRYPPPPPPRPPGETFTESVLPPESRGSGGPAPEPPKVLDEVGREVPDELVPLWQRRQEVQDLMTAVSRVRSTLRRAQEENDELYAHANFSHALATLDQGYTAIAATKPHAVCPYCHGTALRANCRACRKTGFLSKFKWDTAVPEELRRQVLEADA